LALAGRAAREAGIDVPVRLSSVRSGAAGRADNAPGGELIAATLKSYEGRSGSALPAGDRRQIESLLAALRKALADNDGRAELHGYAADALELLGRPGEALHHARRAAEQSQTPAALVRLGKLCAKLQRRADAVAHLESAVRKGADWADVHALLAELLLGMGRRQQARGHLEQALRRNANLRLADGLRDRLAA
jgi:tetratricopeptide (TPR) repeat protein